MKKVAIVVAIILAAHGGPLAVRAAEPVSAEGAEFFEKEIRPLLAENCWKCHGGEEKTEAALNLTSRTQLLAGGDSGAAAVEGKPDDSLLVQVIGYDGDVQMPPDGKLNDSDIEKLTRWVKMGLPWPVSDPAAQPAKSGQKYQIIDEQRSFWSFQPVKVTAPPQVKDTTWPRSQVDRYILARLENEGLHPAPQADKRTLLRRATFDLTGLPPIPDEVQAFLTDDSPQAFERVVERLLGSPHYGERWARHWLDVVRYADSRDARGIGGDTDITEAWRYRDWVVNALNRDLPYDQFIVHQIAGDLLPPPTPDGFNADGLVATGLLAIGEWGTGDADKEKMLTDVVDDQVNVVSRSFLGLTVACARCHDHKFDPIPTADYYSLAGIFYSTHILPSPGAKTAGSSMLRVPLVSPADTQRRAANQARLAEVEKQTQAVADEQFLAVSKSLLPKTAAYMLAAWDYKHRPTDQLQVSPAQFAARRGLADWAVRQWLDFLGLSEVRLLSRPIENVQGIAGLHGWKGESDPPTLLVNTTDQPASFLTITLPPKCVSVHPSQAAGVAVGWRSPIAASIRIAGRVVDADDKCGNGIAWMIEHHRGTQTQELASGSIANAGIQPLDQGKGAERLTSLDVQPGDMIQLVVLPNGEYSCDTTVVELEIATAGSDGKTWSLTHDLLSDSAAGDSASGNSASGSGNPHSDSYGNADVWWFHDLSGTSGAKSKPAADGSLLAQWYEIAKSEASQPDKRAQLEHVAVAVQLAATSVPQGGNDAGLGDELVSASGPFGVATRDRVDLLPNGARSRLVELKSEATRLKQELTKPVPMALAAQEGGVPQSAYEGIHDAQIQIRGSYLRLGERVPRRFPRILAGEDQPAISEGSGRLQLARWIAQPTNPLTARVMVNRIWQHHFGQGIVGTPSNFGKLGERPSHPELLDYLAQTLIDSGWSIKAMHRAIMLSAAYQQSSAAAEADLKLDPDDRFFSRMSRRRLEAEEIRDSLLAFAGRLDRTAGGPSVREFDNTRRTLYLMTIRSDRSGFGPLFDAADPEIPTEVRTISTVAPQALFLMNHPFVLQQAAALAQRAAGDKSRDEAGKIADLYELLYGRPATNVEIQIGQAYLHVTSAPMQAWTEYCQLLMCANEFMYID